MNIDNINAIRINSEERRIKASFTLAPVQNIQCLWDHSHTLDSWQDWKNVPSFTGFQQYDIEFEALCIKYVKCTVEEELIRQLRYEVKQQLDHEVMKLLKATFK